MFDRPTDPNARATTYVALANVFRPPAEAADRSPTVPLADLTRVYHRLFVGPLPPLAHPYESVYRTPEARLMGEVAMEVIEAYAEAGLAIADGRRDLPDHVAVELEFMAFLAGEEAAALAEGDEARAAAYRARQMAFLRDHLTIWIPYFSHRVIEADPGGYYGQAAVTLAAFVVGDLEGLVREQQSAVRPSSPTIGNAAETGKWEVVLHPERSVTIPCTLCGICTEVCRPGALRLDQSEWEATLILDPARCDGCSYCRKYCPERILQIQPATAAASQERQLATSAIARCSQCGGPLGGDQLISEVGLRRIIERLHRGGGDPEDEAAMYLCHACKLSAAARVKL